MFVELVFMISFPQGCLKFGVDYIPRLIWVLCNTIYQPHLFLKSEVMQIHLSHLFLLHRGNTKTLCKYTTLRLVCVVCIQTLKAYVSKYIRTPSFQELCHVRIHRGCRLKAMCCCLLRLKKASVRKWRSSPCAETFHCQLPKLIIFLSTLKIVQRNFK